MNLACYEHEGARQWAHFGFVADMLELPLLLMLSAPTSELDDELVEENAMLKVQLQALEDELREGKRHSYIIVHGYITGSENVMMETMDVDMAKAWCNSHRRCRGFTFGGSDERPGDEVTVTFKARARPEREPARREPANDSLGLLGAGRFQGGA